MRKLIVGVALLLTTASGYAAFTADHRGLSSCSPKAQATAGDSCTSSAGAAACEAPKGKIASHFDPAMSGGCRFACATKLKYDSKDVMAQPGVKIGQLTQCPVSGVVFAVDAHRPHVRLADGDFVTCCERCATKLRQNPHHYLKA
ncbi:MAG: hypothetical protein IT347_04255 [Candidatus Eisenbacteria bacterium]|nr:hypothetical protein [Candidatus Eisenbacteria bacterium]